MHGLSKNAVYKLLLDNPLPKLPDGPDVDALFDPFTYEGEEYYYYYYSTSETWGLGRPVPADQRVAPTPSSESMVPARLADQELIASVAFLPKPKLPPERGEAMMRGPFRYRHRSLCWIYEVNDGRWYLGLSVEGLQAVPGTHQPALFHMMA